MKRYIDEKTGKIVNILEKDEANKIVKILIDYFFSDSTVPAGRLNLVGFLRDFIKLGEIEDLNKIIDYIGEYKKTLKISKEEEENFEVLYKFFRMYKDLEEAKVGIEDATNYISEMTNKKDELAKKEEKDMTKKDKILKVFFDNGFEFKRLAKVACESWENQLKEQMNNGKKEIYVSLEQEIAYQDLLEFATSDNVDISKKQNIVAELEKKQIENKSEVSVKEVVETEDKKEEKVKNQEVKEENKDDVTSKIDINVQVPDRKEPVKIEIETKKEEKANEKVENMDKKEEKVHTIQINPLAGEDDELIGASNSEAKVQAVSKSENPNQNVAKITQHDVESLLGLEDDDLFGNSHNDNVHHKSASNENVESVDKKEEKESANKTIDNNIAKTQNNDEKNRREQGFTSNIQIFVPGVDDVKQQNNVNPSEVKKATENVDLKDSVNFFNNVLDDRMSKKSSFNDDDSDGFRD